MSNTSINTITNAEVFIFKDRFCNENRIIKKLLLHEFAQDFIAPVLDIGAGLGDIAHDALAGTATILLEINPPEKADCPIRPEHERVQGDFFAYNPSALIGTVLISHTLQYLDEDRSKLDEKIAELAPRTIVLISNTNDDFMGELISWCEANFPHANPERRLNGFPVGYRIIRSVKFEADLVCPDFRTLAEQVAYLMLVPLEEKENLLISYLQKRLPLPRFSFSQIIESYARK